MSDEWNTDIQQAPYREVLEVINDQMDEPVLATRGYVMQDGSVHCDQTYFSSVGTWCSRAGQLVIPNRWRTKT